MRALPGTHEAVADINALGMVSMVGSAVPSLLLILALRRVSLPALAAIALALTAAGITMYDGRSLTAHRTAIFVSISLLVLCAAALLAAPPSHEATVAAR